MSGINWFAVAVTVVGIMGLGAFWYSPVFLGNKWMKSMNIKAEDISQQDAMRGIMISFATCIISTITMALLMNTFGLDSGREGLLFGLAVGTGIVGMTQLSNIAYEQENVAEVFLISGSYRMVSFLFAGWLLGFWR